jgi:hypothetical protein
MITPFTKPEGGELMEWQDEFNKQVNKIRYVIERHASEPICTARWLCTEGCCAGRAAADLRCVTHKALRRGEVRCGGSP